MPTGRPTSKAGSHTGRLIITSSFFVTRAGESRTGGSSANLLRAVVDARLDERARVLREQIAVTRRMVRELGGRGEC